MAGPLSGPRQKSNGIKAGFATGNPLNGHVQMRFWRWGAHAASIARAADATQNIAGSNRPRLDASFRVVVEQMGVNNLRCFVLVRAGPVLGALWRFEGQASEQSVPVSFSGIRDNSVHRGPDGRPSGRREIDAAVKTFAAADQSEMAPLG